MSHCCWHGGHTPALLRKRRHEPLGRSTELLRIEQPEQPSEHVMAGKTILQPKEAAKERPFRLRELGHVRRNLAAREHRTKDDHQQTIKIAQNGIAD